MAKLMTKNKNARVMTVVPSKDGWVVKRDGAPVETLQDAARKVAKAYQPALDKLSRY